ncbi:NAD(P)-dependent alcohol dehydrogenase [Marinigracilibium pacificum]|uniref:NAD(P)-dependent alcohol dehydrogenase n=1 Tax=Marinigracilibium pacificum TaxID=2729599 RepID=A0A848IWM0_9BACT|nr:NAD(P)-dependent alcohol dehydrogenase [Marinigracilibium pacificum]NMM47675.1 NAD(P)-dependent alcohol dehydrogenase [Marinigracilibium pacificum]
MKAFTKTKYGGPEVLKLSEVEKPKVKDGQVLIRIKANSANPADWHVIRGTPYFARLSFGLFKPKHKIPGSDFAGVIEEVGSNVAGFNVGDRVFGEMLNEGVFAEFACAPAHVCAKMPANATFKEMAAVPIAGLTALQALITHGKLKKGESVLINGSSGGVGHFAIQIAKAFGGEVTAICSSKNIDFVKSIGADHAIAYDKVDIHGLDKKYDLVIDNHGNLNFSDFSRMGNRGIMVGFTTMNQMISVVSKSAFSKFPLKVFTASANTKDLGTLANLIENGKLKPHLEKEFNYKEIPQAIAYIEKMHTRGKVVMVWNETPD